MPSPGTRIRGAAVDAHFYSRILQVKAIGQRGRRGVVGDEDEHAERETGVDGASMTGRERDEPPVGRVK